MAIRLPVPLTFQQCHCYKNAFVNNGKTTNNFYYKLMIVLYIICLIY